jgi:GNAT superfamily N-acetyltransferase
MILPDGYSDVPAGKIACVVTHLEMTARPALSSSPSGPWTLRQVDHPELAWYRDLYRRVGEEFLWYSRIRAADEKLAARLHHPLVETHSLVADGRDEGLLELDFREPETCEIGMFGVTASLVGTGAAHWLMQHAQALAWSRAIKRLWLHTCTFDHPAAIPFYRRAGFRPFRRQIEIDDDPRLDGSAPRDVARHVPVIE